MNHRIEAQRTRMYAAIRAAHPLYFGDPFEFYNDSAYRGPAYGERLGGGAGLVGAALAVVTGGASLGFTTLASTLSTISVIGSVVGAVTGNKTFSTIGALAGLGGTFMNLSASGTFGADMQKWSESANSAFTDITGQSAASNISDAAKAGGDIVAQDGGGWATTPPGDALQSAGTADTMGDLNLKAASGPEGATPPAGNNPDELGVTTGSTTVSDGGALPPAGNNPDEVASIAAGGQPPGGLINTAPSEDVASSLLKKEIFGDGALPKASMANASTAGGTTATAPSLWGKLTDFVNNNKALTEIALKGISSAYVSPSEQRQRNALSELYESRTATERQQLENMNSAANIDVSKMMSVNPSANIYKPKPVVAAGVRPAGLIQSRS